MNSDFHCDHRPANRTRRGGHVFLLLVLVCAGCASLPKPTADWNERRTIEVGNTSWSRALSPAIKQHEGESGVELLAYGRDALAARLALADTAERCLDAQYYIWESDDAGRLLADRLLNAADRGVHVRLLLDDLGTSKSDDVLLALDSHTNVEVRLFNPVANRFFRRFGVLFDFSRVNRRMHNKSFTADRLMTIVGGRNVADRYYSAGDQPHFADFDVLAAGPAATDVAAMFDRYWWSSSSIPIHALNRKRLSSAQLAEFRGHLQAGIQSITNSPAFSSLDANDVATALNHHQAPRVWGRAKLVCDLPEKVTFAPDDTSTHLLPELRQVVNGTTDNLFIISPYFVPGQKGVEFFRSLRQRGIRVTVLSNSLAATDVAAVHAGYRRYRKDLLRDGVELFEFKPNAELRASKTDRARKSKNKSSSAALHAKVFVFDRRMLFVGSLNLDPRSARLNTEMGLLIDIPELAGSVVDSLSENIAQNAYRLEFKPGPGPCKECGRIVWISRENNEEVRYAREPMAGLSRRFWVCCLSLLPIESQL